MAGTDKRKQSLYFPESMLQDIQHEAEQHRVLHWHYRAHGRSGLPVDPAKIDLASHAQDLVATMDAAGIETAIVIGHSMGTQVALEAYRLAPSRVHGLVLMCGSYKKI